MSDEKKDVVDQQGPVVIKYDEVPWDTGNRPVSELKGLMKKAAEQGARRKKVITGQAGFYMNRSVMPAGFEVPVHNHSHDEFFVVMEGGCTFDDDVILGKGDCIVIYAKYRYGFVCGPEGMDFMTIRTGEATLTL
jgi:quercetin dioxygenase-like cupin family protein